MVTNDVFAETYITLRKKEERIYTDTEVLKLPDIDASHVHYKEWLIRKQSAKKLLSYLNIKASKKSILEVGCGNGWLTNRLAGVTSGDVVGIDINKLEIDQAVRLFKDKYNLRFINTEITSIEFLNRKFDAIIFAASIQYFESLKNILTIASSRLAEKGEIHIIDTKFYSIQDAVLAQQRSDTYYSSLGLPQMSGQYFHHTLEEFKGFNYKILFNPDSLLHKLSFYKNPFYWIVIKKAGNIYE
jgi:ubiquinone/menaquinone biosynthesis C-methylase UbiE